MLQRAWITQLHRLLALGVMAWVARRASVLLGACWEFDTDDAFITLRYARHLSEGRGIVWNPGEPPVEGYSNFLFVLLGAAFELAQSEPLYGLKVLSCAALATTCVFMYALARSFVGPLASCIGPVLLVVHPGASYWTVSGMETAVYQCEVVTATYLCARALGHRSVGWYTDSPQRVRPAATGWVVACVAVCLLAALTRPEGPLLAICINLALALRWLSLRRNASHGRSAQRALHLALLFGLGFGLLYGSYFMWRWSYFGRVLPNPVYCKGAWNGDPWKMLTDFWDSSRLVIVIALLYPVRKLDARHVPLLLLAACYMWILHGTNPIISYYDRHWMGALALLLVAASVSLASAARLLTSSYGWNLEIVLCGAVLFASSPTYEETRREVTYTVQKYVRRNAARREVAQYLTDHLPADATYVLGDCGLIPYTAPQKVFDAYCLNSREMTGPEINLSAVKYMRWTLDQSPAAYVVISRRKDRVTPRLEHGNMFYVGLMKDARFKKHYRKVHVAGARGDQYHYHVYKRIAPKPPMAQGSKEPNDE